MGTSPSSFERVATLEFTMKLALILGCLSVALAEPEAQYPGFYNYPTVYTYPYPTYGLTHSSPYLPLVYTHPKSPTIYDLSTLQQFPKSQSPMDATLITRSNMTLKKLNTLTKN